MSAMDEEIRIEYGFSYRHSGLSDAPRAVIALHGSGADETSMLPLAQAIDPDAYVITPRGRVNQNGELRWFTKNSPVDFDQQSIHDECDAFAHFLEELFSRGAFDPSNTVFLGYSNGGNLLSSTLLLHPQCMSRMILLRCMPVLSNPPSANLDGKSALVIAGERDLTYGPFGPALVELLRARNVATRFSTVDAGHEFGDRDIEIARQWLLDESAAISVVL